MKEKSLQITVRKNPLPCETLSRPFCDFSGAESMEGSDQRAGLGAGHISDMPVTRSVTGPVRTWCSREVLDSPAAYLTDSQHWVTLPQTLVTVQYSWIQLQTLLLPHSKRYALLAMERKEALASLTQGQKLVSGIPWMVIFLLISWSPRKPL